MRGCSRREAFDELVRAVNQTGLGLGALAAGLVAIAGGTSTSEHAEAFTVWGELIRRARPLTGAH